MKRVKHLITQKNSGLVILFIDELDNIFTSNSICNQDLFEVFNLSDYPKSCVITIGISNSIDLIVQLSQKKKIPLPKMKHLVFQ